MQALIAAFSRFGPGRLAAMGAVTLTLAGFLGFVTLRASQPAMGVLFTDLSSADVAAITKELDTRGVVYETRDDGGTLLAPKSDVPRLRIDLAGKSLPSGGGVGYEIFDKGDAFSSTSFVQGINQLRALEGELARSIRSIGRVQAARVHLALPERRLFERDREAARASIVLKTRGDLGPDQVAAIRHLVASAVQGLTPERISIVDERGRLLAGAGSDDVSAAVGTSADDRRVATERRLRRQVEDILSGIVGPGRSRVQVAADLELNRIESRQESYDPESRVLRSSQTRGESSTTASSEGQVSVGNELPGARDAAASQPRDNSSKTEEVVNYEISHTTRTEVLEPGRVKRLSVAVVVDGIYTKGPNGEAIYQPRPKEDLDRIAALVRGAIGFDKSRGDQVEVANLPLAEPPAALPIEEPSLLASLFAPTRDDIVHFIELGVLALLTLVVLLVAVRPMVKRVIAPDAPRLYGSGVAGAIAGRAGQIAGNLLEAAREGGALPSPMDVLTGGTGVLLPADAATAEQISRVGELAKASPKEAATVLRGWMNDR